MSTEERKKERKRKQCVCAPIISNLVRWNCHSLLLLPSLRPFRAGTGQTGHTHTHTHTYTHTSAERDLFSSKCTLTTSRHVKDGNNINTHFSVVTFFCYLAVVILIKLVNRNNNPNCNSPCFSPMNRERKNLAKKLKSKKGCSIVWCLYLLSFFFFFFFFSLSLVDNGTVVGKSE